MKTPSIIVAALAVQSLTAGLAYAHGDHIISGHNTSQITEITYDHSAYNRGIHSYPVLVAPRVLNENDVVYIDRASGQAIFSYPRNAADDES